MLKVLIKKQLLELFQTYFVNAKTGKSRSKKGTVMFFALLAILFISLGSVFYGMASGYGSAILNNGYNWLFFAIMGLLAMALGVFGSVFNTYASVYLPKDNELLMSLPIKNETLLLSRLAGVYATSLMYSGWIWIPIVLAYWGIVKLNVLNILFPILMTFIIALFVTVLSCLLGWVVAYIASKTKGKSIITLLLSITVFVLYYYVYFNIAGQLNVILGHINELGTVIKSWLHYSYLMGKASDGDVVSLLAVTAITCLLAFACYYVLSRSFTKLSNVTVNRTKNKNTERDYNRKSVRRALVMREFKHFISVSTWVLNGGFGLLLLPIGAIVLLAKADFIPVISAEIPQLYSYLPMIMLFTVCFVLSTNAILPVSISMEGNTFWQLQALPIDPWEVLRAKQSMCFQLNIYPAIFFSVICGIVLNIRWWEIILVCIAVVLFILVVSGFGLFLNLKMPNFNWTNAATLTKQSAPVVINMFGGWIFCAILAAGGLLLSGHVSSWIILCGYIVIFAILTLVLNKWLKGKGVKIFKSL